MKTAVTFAVLVSLAMFTGVHDLRASQVEGFWQSNRTGIGIEVEDTYDGIRVKRTDQSRWRYYESRSGKRFVDFDGNSYALSGRQLIWKSDRGRKTIRFERVAGYGYGDSGYYGDEYGGYEDYDDYYDEDGLGGVHPDGSYCPAGFSHRGTHKQLTRAQVRRLRSMEGRWTDRYSSTELRIRVNRKAVHVDRNGRHLHFFPAGNDRLISDHGEVLFVSRRNRLIWKSRRGRTMAFSKGRINNYYCD